MAMRAGDEFGVSSWIDHNCLRIFSVSLRDHRMRSPKSAPARPPLKLADANPAGAIVLQRGIEALVQRQPLGVGPAIQDACQGNLIDRCRDRAARV